MPIFLEGGGGGGHSLIVFLARGFVRRVAFFRFPQKLFCG